MRVILSRKGFDTKYGGIPSPILEDGTLLSLPIPVNGSPRKYSDLFYNRESFEDIIKQLKRGFNRTDAAIDPDLRPEIFNAPSNWVASFGIGKGEITHFKNQQVGVDDLVLFFGWFKEAERNNGKLRYVKGAPDLHIIYAYMQLGNIIDDSTKATEFYYLRPYIEKIAPLSPSNKLCVARDTCSWDETRKGSGVLKYDKRLVLTKEGMGDFAKWGLPDFFRDKEISLSCMGDTKIRWKQDEKGDWYFQFIKSPGQWFAIQDNPEVEAWAKELVALSPQSITAQPIPAALSTSQPTPQFVIDYLERYKDNKKEALNALEADGLVWKRSTDYGIDKMRAIMAAKKIERLVQSDYLKK